jgi:DNA polymerase alpha-associated DNA helicase A
MGWSNSQFYGNRLKAHESVESHRLGDIYQGVDEGMATLMMVDTAGCDMGEDGNQMESKMNVGEADIAAHLYKKLFGYGVPSRAIAILTPYSKQVSLIKSIIQ